MKATQEENMPRSEPEWRDYVAQKFRDGDERMLRMEGDIKTNTVITQSIKEDTAGLVNAWNIGKNTSKAAEIIGSLAIWIVKTAVAVGVLWAAFKVAVSGKVF